jgi:uncharacterized SAM-binding protein YcdF (DUF218 family)
LAGGADRQLAWAHVISDASFFWPRLIWLVLNPVNILLAAMCLSLMLWRLRGGRSARRLMVGCTAILVALAILPVGRAMTAALEWRFPPPDAAPARVDGIVVLGGSVDLTASERLDFPVLNGSGGRLTAFAELAAKYPAARLVFTGGDGRFTPGPGNEADYSLRALRLMGIDPARVRIENESRTTYESARLAQALADAKPSETWLLVTSSRHMPRAIGTFRKQGWNVRAWPTDFTTRSLASALRPRFDLVGGLREFSEASRAWIGLVAYRIMGRSSELWPAPIDSAAAST